MFHFSIYNHNFPIILQDPYSFALPFGPNQLQYHNPVRTRSGRHSRPSNKLGSSTKQTDTQRATLKAGLQKSLDESNKGFKILKKMGYEVGKPLGKDGVGITEPLTLPVKDNPRDRAGLGQEPKTVAVKKEQIKSKANTSKESTKQSPYVDAKPKQKDSPSTSPVTKTEKRLLQLKTDHKEDIELLRLRLQAELTDKSKNFDSMIVTHVTIEDEPIGDEVFKIIHQYLVNSLHVYTGSPFPMFHDIAHVDEEIKVVCEDIASMEYLSTCIAALSTNLSIPMTTTRNSPIGNNVYWFSVQIQSQVSGVLSFFSQLKKHRFEIKPDRWIIVSQHTCPKANKTNLQILVDEYSAMSLIFRYNLKLLVCMQEMQFKLKGKVPFDN